ncbi:hypothetical protein KGP36_06915 [Patescibacteria group bacterium]|nr:hypothetical protein [Patescibacteria group bacterium]
MKVKEAILALHRTGNLLDRLDENTEIGGVALICLPEGGAIELVSIESGPTNEAFLGHLAKKIGEETERNKQNQGFMKF